MIQNIKPNLINPKIEIVFAEDISLAEIIDDLKEIIDNYKYKMKSINIRGGKTNE